MTGRAVQILQTQNNNVTQFDNEALEAVFLREDVRDKRVVVVSISGIFGKGKSFLLNYMLKYLNSQFEKHPLKRHKIVKCLPDEDPGTL
uniref:GB1/RHD3-type G domain-containing protein n=1 Tax=Timema tahoe TaxID=61484 RepID=A0A7R9IJ24_9NEOP|nr:unnamed protein product [Timema tahoe]